jgi:hypothetical protein
MLHRTARLKGNDSLEETAANIEGISTLKADEVFSS